MKTALMAAALGAALVTVAAVPSMASTTPIPTTPVSGTDTFTYYSFMVSGGQGGSYKTSVSTSNDAEFSGTGVNIYNRNGGALVQAGQTFGGGDFAKVTASLTAGMTYVLRFQTTGLGSYNGSITGGNSMNVINLMPTTGVPLPNSVALFGAAVAAVGVAGALRRKGSVARAA